MRRGIVNRVVLIGCGAVSEQLYVPSLCRLLKEGRIESVTLIDKSAERLAVLRRRLPEADVFSSISDVIDKVDGDLAIIALPHHLHSSVTIDALKAGAHVLCEKPMACTVSDCDAMIEAAQLLKRKLAVGHFRRLFPVTRLIRDWIRNERLGRLLSFRILEGEIYSWPAVSDSFFQREAAGGGVLIDAGAHTLDLVLWWMGEADAVEYWDDAAGGVETNCVLKLRMRNGASGYIQMSRDWPLANKYLFKFEHGWMMYVCDKPTSVQWGFHGDDYVQRVELDSANVSGFDGLPREGVKCADFLQCFDAQIRNVLAATTTDKEPLFCSGEEARGSIALIERCYRSKQLLPQSWLPPNEQMALKIRSQL
jgi:predicted dehydrogenase